MVNGRMVQLTQRYEWVFRDLLIMVWVGNLVCFWGLPLSDQYLCEMLENSLKCVREEPFQAPVSSQNVWQVHIKFYLCGSSEMGLCGSSWWWFWDLLLIWPTDCLDMWISDRSGESKVTKRFTYQTPASWQNASHIEHYFFFLKRS